MKTETNSFLLPKRKQTLQTKKANASEFWANKVEQLMSEKKKLMKQDHVQ